MSTSLAITRPTSAYDILTWVQEHIHEEPKRIRMGQWYSKIDPADVLAFPHRYPRCGTIACEAGWIAERCGVDLHANYPIVNERAVDWTYMATLIAGFDPLAEDKLRRSFTSGDHFDTPDGTPEQAAATVAFLQGFKRTWKRQLQARMILPGGVVQGARSSAKP